jgi:hypothetical protein
VSGSRLVVLVLGLVLSAGIALHGRTPDFQSRWPSRDIIVDGVDDEWDVLARVGKVPISAAFANDGSDLFVCLVTSDPGARMQMLRGALVVWFDSGGGKKKRLGVRFPIGGGFDAMRRPGSRGDLPWERPGRDEPRSIPEELQRQIELLGPGKNDRRIVNHVNVPDIEARLGLTEGGLSYELRIPLSITGDEKIGIGTRPGAVIGVGLETMEPEGLRQPSFSWGTGGRGGMGMPGRGGLGGGMRPPMLLNIKAWATVKLAELTE